MVIQLYDRNHACYSFPIVSKSVSYFAFSKYLDEIPRGIPCRIRDDRRSGLLARRQRSLAPRDPGIRDPARSVSLNKEVKQMVRWYYQSVFDELEEMRKYMESLSRQMYETSPVALLPGPVEPGLRMLPAQRANLRVDVTETDQEVVVTADMIPGVSKKDISLDLINPQVLEISCERRDEKKEENEGYYLRERTFGSMNRIVPLPGPVTGDGSSSSFKNGVLEVHLKKRTKEPRGRIAIE
jgi:HSP20 family protein